MLHVLIAEAVRRVRRHLPRRDHAAGHGTSRMLVGEVGHLLRIVATAPGTVVVLMGLAAAAGILVALGPGYPGPVAPVGARWGLVALALAASVGVARTVPPRWREVRHAVRRARVGLALVAVSASVSLVKVGLHDTTPGPVLPAPLRWATVALIAVAAAVAIARGNGRSDAPRRGSPRR